MENTSNNKYQCSSKDHSEFPAETFCQKCEIYMCSKCDSIHSNLCPNHSKYSLINNNNSFSEIFTGFCPLEKHHQIELDYYCKSHNELICAACIAKIKDKENGQHKDCEVYSLQEIKEEKKNELNKNIIFLENMKKNYEEKYEEMKDIYEYIFNEKEKLKLYLQNIFDEIKNNINIRQKQLLLEIDNQFNDIFCNEDIIKESENLPNKIKSFLDKGYNINKKWNNSSENIKLNSIINDCINIQKGINEINIIYTNIKKCDINNNTKIIFLPEKEEINTFIEKIKNFGKITSLKNYIKYSFKPYPLNITINEKRKYEISGEENIKNILTKTGQDGWMGTICNNILEEKKIYKWKIKILKTQNKHIMIGIAPNDFDINLSDYTNCGYYYYIYNSTLYSGPPFNYYGENSFLSKLNEENEIIIVVNLKKRSIKFIINGEDKGESYKNIPEDKPLSPAVILYNQNDSIEISSL